MKGATIRFQVPRLVNKKQLLGNKVIMDLSRFFLYAALAVVSYLLLLAWNEDYPNQIPEPVSQPVADLADLPETVTTSETLEDIPTQIPPAQTAQPTQSTNSSTPTAPQTVTATNASRIVTVATDTLRLNIDLNGGDIVYLALLDHLRELDNPDEPFVLLQNDPGRSYVAQSGLIGTNGIDSSSRANYQSTQTAYSMNDNQDSLSVELITATEFGVDVIKRFSFTRGSHVIDVTYQVTNNSSSTWQANVFGQIKRDGFPDPSDAGGFSRTFLGFAATSEEDPYIKIDFDDVDDGVQPIDITGGWISFSQHYFITAWIPDQDRRNNFSTRKTATINI